MKIAIVGTSKCTTRESLRIRNEIEKILSRFDPKNDQIVSGGAKGVDSIAEDAAKLHGFKTVIYRADTAGILPIDRWERCYKPRNLEIAHNCDIIFCITTEFKNEYCYHCKTGDHQRTGGCWTYKQCNDKQKYGIIVVQKDKIENMPSYR